MMMLISFGLGLLLAVFMIYVIRNVYQLPYPSEGIFRNPDANGVIESLRLAKEGTTVKWVMGTFNPKIFADHSVEDAIYRFLEKNIELEIIVGPRINPESEHLVRYLIGKKNVIIRQLPYNPKRHFQIISNEHLRFEPREHPEDELSKYVFMKKARAMLGPYEKFYSKYKEDSKILIEADMDRIFGVRGDDS